MCEVGEGRGVVDEVRERSPLHELGDRDQLGFFDPDINIRDKFRERIRRTGAGSTVLKGPLVRLVYFPSDLQRELSILSTTFMKTSLTHTQQQHTGWN